MIRDEMPRSKHDAAFRARALEFYVIHGAAEASRLLDGAVTPELLRTWAHRAGVTLHGPERTEAATAQHVATMEERRVRLADRLLEIAELSVEEVKPLIANASLRELVGAWDYAIKNSQLLAGQATVRTEGVAAEVLEVADELAARRAKRAA